MLHFAPKLTTKALDAVVAKTFPRLQVARAVFVFGSTWPLSVLSKAFALRL